MSDPRFYFLHKPLSAQAVAGLAGADLVCGDPKHRLSDVAALSSAKVDELTFARDHSVLKTVGHLDAGLCFCPPDLVDPLKALGVHTIAVCEHPGEAFARAASHLVTPRQGARQSEVIAPDANIADSAHIGFGVCIGAGVEIREGSVIGNGANIGAGCVIGRNCNIGVGAVISFTIMGDYVNIYPGAVLGEAGLGVFVDKAGVRAVTHFGLVNIADEVRIGANTCVDRAVFGETSIGARCKIDNLVQIAHNVHLGTDCVLASLCGIAGSTVLGNGVMMGGRAGIVDHIKIENNVQIGAAAVVTKNIKAGEIWSGHPARPLRDYLREQVMLRDLAKKKRGRGIMRMNETVPDDQTITMEEVCHFLPHRYPFLMVDRAEDFISGKSITGIKAVSANEPFFQGHFPGNPVMPGVLLIEAMGQSGALLSTKTLGLKPGEQTIMFLGVEKGRFRRPVVPGDFLHIPVKLIKVRRNIHFYEGEVRSNGALCAQCTFSAMAVPGN